MLRNHFKRKIVKSIYAAVFLPVFANAQVRTVPPAYNVAGPVSYIRTWEPVQKLQSTAQLGTWTTPDIATMTTQYLDGIGRPVETVVKQGSAATSEGVYRDAVSSIEYDEYGRPQFNYLPFVANNANGNTNINDGYFKQDPFAQQAVHAAAQYPGESYFYGKTAWENNPLNRVIAATAPGKWMQLNKSVNTGYYLNTSTDAVIIWNVSDVTDPLGDYAQASSPATYPAGTLTKQIVTDEANHQVITYTDNEGKVILKKVQISGSGDNGTGSNHTGFLCTYYMYDALGLLRCVLQPEGVKSYLSGTAITNTTLLNEQCFRYQYDKRGRMIRKKVPGAGEVYMVYDNLDRLVMTQDANLRNSSPVKWMITIYDSKDRPIETGLIEDGTNSFATHLANAYNSVEYPDPADYTYENLTYTHYDVYSNTNAFLQGTLDNSFSSQLLSGTSDYSVTVTPAQCLATRGLVTWSEEKILGSAYYKTVVNTYDDRGRSIQVADDYGDYNKSHNILTTQYSWTGQPLLQIHSQVNHITGALNPVTVTKYHYDMLKRLVSTEKKVAFDNVNSGALSAYKTIATSEYDKIGQLTNKKLAPGYYNAANNSFGLENLKYDYNIRGWMLGMNRDYTRDISNNNFFGFDLGYENVTNVLINSGSYGAAQYTGNIAGTSWKSKGDGEKRKYNFTYDYANRLLKADFTQYTGGTFNQTAGVNFDMKMGDGSDVTTAYDDNGNIKQMQQWGLKINASSQIDNLRYTYLSGSNKLKSVTDFNNDINTKLGDFRTANTHPQYSTKSALTGSSTQSQFDAITDYTYDVNGNMNADNNKAISSITYNFLNLPELVTITGKGTIKYDYDATGNKLRKTVTENVTTPATATIVTITDYRGGLVYETKTTTPADPNNPDYADRLQFMPQEEGRIRYKPAAGATAASFAWDYFLKDHLGNVRAVTTEDDQADHYPTATLESSGAGSPVENEKTYFDINNAYVQNQPATLATTYINDNGTNNPNTFGNANANSQKMYKLNANTNRTGLGIVLKVMAGDKVNVLGKSYYYTANSVSNSVFDASALITAFLGVGGASNAAVTHGATSAALNGNSGTTVPLNTFTNSNPVNPYNNVKAGISYVLLDEQFKFAGGGFDPVDGSANGALKSHVLPNVNVAKNGYVYIYCSNESILDVFFDNLEVIHTRGQLLEETHYYPFGLTMAGISTEAATMMKNKIKYNSIEFDNDLDLNNLNAALRDLDPQTGRWWQEDPKVDEMYTWSPYTSNFDNPIRYKDQRGDAPEGCPPFCLPGSEVLGSVLSTVIGWNTDLHQGAAKIYSGANEKAASDMGMYKEQNTLAQSFHDANGTMKMNEGVLQTVRPGLEAANIVGGSMIGAELTEAPLVTGNQIFGPEAFISLETRASQIHGALSPGTQSRTTTAVAHATTEDGSSVILVGSSEKNLRPAQIAALKPGEIPVSGPGHAETTILDHAAANGMKVNYVAASRPICTSCAPQIFNAGAKPVSPLKAAFPGSIPPPARAVKIPFTN